MEAEKAGQRQCKEWRTDRPGQGRPRVGGPERVLQESVTGCGGRGVGRILVAVGQPSFLADRGAIESKLNDRKHARGTVRIKGPCVLELVQTFVTSQWLTSLIEGFK